MEGTVSITITESPPRAVHGGTREEVKTINEFTFDLQRFTETEVADFSTLKTTIGSARKGDIIKLTSDITITEKLEVKGGITLDLNGHTITTNSSNAFEIKK